MTTEYPPPPPKWKLSESQDLRVQDYPPPPENETFQSWMETSNLMVQERLPPPPHQMETWKPYVETKSVLPGGYHLVTRLHCSEYIIASSSRTKEKNMVSDLCSFGDFFNLEL